MITCSKCKETKPTTDYWKDSSRSSGYKGYCKKCKPDRKTYFKTWQEKKLRENPDYWKKLEANRDPATRRASNRKSTLKKYNLTPEEYQQILEAQNGKCAICKKKETFDQTGKELAVDHSHKTGEVRGLLCQTCNQALGMLGDSLELLHSAISYLAKSEQRVG
jgi:phage-related protein